MAGTVIFGGTTEGRDAAARERDALVCVTSDYAASLLPPGTRCHVGRLDHADMLDLLRSVRPERVVDATHPYAVRAHVNIRECCKELKLNYERVERPGVEGEWRSDVIHAESPAIAAEILTKTGGNILLTTGSHTLNIYTQAVLPERIYARVLPTHEALDLCRDAGMPANHIIAMQGPFTRELNAALYDQLSIRVMVTKDSGAPGGLEEKVIPALERNIEVIMIDRPKGETCAEKV